MAGSVIRNKNRSGRDHKRSKALEDINSSLLLHISDEIIVIILFRLGVVDFAAFSCVCKRLRSIAHSNWNKFMATRLPMALSFSTIAYKKQCYLEDINRDRKFKINVPHSMGRTCVGVTCGYLILYGSKAYDFLLVNPFTRDELRSPRFPIEDPADIKGLLVSSPSMPGLVFLVTRKPFNILSFYFAGKEADWKHLLFDSIIHDIHFFQGKIYTLHEGGHLFEVRFNPKPHLTLVETYTLKEGLPKLASWGEKLYVLENASEGGHEALWVDFDEKKGGYSMKKKQKYALFVNVLKSGGVGKVGLWAPLDEEYIKFGNFHGKVNHTGRLFNANMWYSLHDCLDVNRLLE